ncbi:hypothetical protein F4775DRAFT_570077 [Biscogniauxia sp. FL1348]|nr:hypothetical protein F4775DRAFT_570077 [Biscogniauxia sp. FL1348]
MPRDIKHFVPFALSLTLYYLLDLATLSGCKIDSARYVVLSEPVLSSPSFLSCKYLSGSYARHHFSNRSLLWISGAERNKSAYI